MHEWAPEIRVDEPLARRLIREQFPDVEGRSFQLLDEGWDTTVYLVDERWTFRFPRKEMVIPGFRNEIAHLPALAPADPGANARRRAVRRIPLAVLWSAVSPRPRARGGGSGRRRACGACPPAGRVPSDAPRLELDADLPLDPVRRADMPFRVERTRDRMDRLGRKRLWHAPPLVEELLVEAERIPRRCLFASATATSTSGISSSEKTEPHRR
ncbi:MAG TPA: hypothetical protein VKA24_02620 [Gaiellaceae bacterium]|nr:hypothetical protein [Gaiellaceae bacterium]